jgi:DNA-binding PadR family transcriptional regulator
VVLGLVVQRPGYGYDLGKRIDERMGPGWQLNPSAIYGALDRLEEKEWVQHELRELRGRSPRSRERILYRATDAGVHEFERWLGSPVRKEPVRMDVLARIAVSRAEHAGLILVALDRYERECLDMLACATGYDPDSLAPWDRLVAAGVRDSILQHLRAELSWVKAMRRRIREFGRSYSLG